ncbi:MAG: Cytosolic copper metallochaperone [Alyxoria varia]|nr:MAG: Cytosolic copper metallochaperone [Alyxoria varia]
MATHTYDFKVEMMCGGCTGAVERVIKKLDGVSNYKVSLPDQLAQVVVPASESNADVGEPDYSTVLEKIKKTGKTVNKGWVDGVEKEV